MRCQPCVPVGEVNHVYTLMLQEPGAQVGRAPLLLISLSDSVQTS